MTPVRLLFIALATLAAMTFSGIGAFAQDAESTPTLDELFADLKVAETEMAAREITNQIWVQWTQPDDPKLAEWMTELLQLRRVADNQRALVLVNYIVENYPDYAEGWNQRATLYYVMGDYEKSLADVDETLKREPRHFGALAGQAVIYLKLGEDEEALKSITEALRYHPFLTERHLFPQLVEPAVRT